MRDKRFLKAAVISFLLAGLMAVPLFSQGSFYRYLQIEYSAMGWTDLGVSYLAINHIGGFEEIYAPGKFLIKNPGLAIAVQLGMDFAVHVFADRIYKDNKALAFGFLIVMNLGRAYIMYHNFKVLGD